MVEPVIPEESLHGVQWHSLGGRENMLTFPRNQKHSKVVKRPGSRTLLGFPSSLCYQTAVRWGQLLKIPGNQAYEKSLAESLIWGQLPLAKTYFPIFWLRLSVLHFTKKRSASGKAHSQGIQRLWLFQVK